MGFQVRKRTKGKDSWFNFSGSKKNGLGVSMSVKLAKNITHNTRGRTTINFGNGFKYVHYSKKKKDATATKPKRDYDRSSSRSTRHTAPTKTYSHQEIISNFQAFIANPVRFVNYTHAELQVLVDFHNSLDILKNCQYGDTISRVERDTIIVNMNLYAEIAAAKPDHVTAENIETIVDYVRTQTEYRTASVTDIKPETKWEKFIGSFGKLISAFK